MDQYILFHENNTEETQIKHASILSHLDRRTLQCVTSIYKPTFLKKTMCSEFQIGIVASPIHFLLTKLGGMSWANHWWSPGSWMLNEWSRTRIVHGGSGMSYCPSQTNRKTDDLFICSLTTWIWSSVNCLFKPFPFGLSFCFQFAKLLFVFHIYVCIPFICHMD